MPRVRDSKFLCNILLLWKITEMYNNSDSVFMRVFIVDEAHTHNLGPQDVMYLR